MLDEPFVWKKEDTNLFRIFNCTDGSGKIVREEIREGEAVMIPAGIKEMNITPDGSLELRETYIDTTIH